MRSRTLGFWITTAYLCVIATVAATATQREDTKTKAGATRHAATVEVLPDFSEEDVSIGSIGSVVPIRPGAKVHRIVVTAGVDGGVILDSGTVSGPEASCADSDDAVYCNTLGRSIFVPVFLGRFADDITTTAIKSNGCFLDRYVIRVTGDGKQDGTPAALLPYTVRYALYEFCPGAAINPRPIDGTDGELTIPSACVGGDNNGNPCTSDDQCPGGACGPGLITEIVVVPDIDVPLPSNVYLAVTFSRAKAGVVFGAPPEQGYSADKFDFPGFPCQAALGVGFPESPHSSFYAELFVRDDCSESHVAYKNSNHAGGKLSPGDRVLFADDVVLGGDGCTLIGYQIAYKGNGVIQADLKTGLSALDAEDGNVIPGSRETFFSIGNNVQVGNKRFAPFQVQQNQTLWISFKTVGTAGAPILTCKQAELGTTADLYMIFRNGEWQTEDNCGRNCWCAFDVTLFCEGSPPIGACCDMFLVDDLACVGGPNNGNPCTRRADCPGCPDSTSCCVGESVCRELPEINCASSVAGIGSLWKDGRRCGPACVGGGNAGELCSDDAECIVCVGGAADGLPCNGSPDCAVAVCVGGANDTQVCSCPNGSCDDGDNNVNTPSTCNADSDNAGDVCVDCPDGDCDAGTCPASQCRGSFCEGGTNDGEPCTREADCPDGTCGRGGPFARPCGVGACCKPLDAELPSCGNFTERECTNIQPVGVPRLFQRGRFCEDQNCPLAACIGREGECTRPRTAVCLIGPIEGEDCNPQFNDCGPFFCVGGTRDGESCNTDENCPDGDVPGLDEGGCARGICLGGSNDGEACANSEEATHCPEGQCIDNCKGSPGCEDPFCCSDVCNVSGQEFCCLVHWDPLCASQAFVNCARPPANDECTGPGFGDGAELVDIIPSTTEADLINATGGSSDPGFCCHTDDPGVRAPATVWFKFVAIDTSALLSTCNSDARAGFRAEDSLIQVFSVSDPDRGVCGDRVTVCSVRKQDCPDSSECVLDEVTACENLNVIACNDDGGDDCACGGGGATCPARSRLCVTNLVPGELYYVLLAAKSTAREMVEPGEPEGPYLDLGVYKLNISSPCSLSETPLHNDLCGNAEQHTGGDTEPLVIPFDLTGDMFGEGSVTFDCPGPSRFCLVTLENDVWYDWTAPCTGQATIETCDGNNTPDTGLVVYDGCDCPVEITDELACSDFRPSPCFLGSKVTIDVTEGNCYKVRLGGHLGGEPAGNLTITMTCDCAVPADPITFIDPPDGVVDARQPHPPDDVSHAQGIDSIRVRVPDGAGARTDLCDGGENADELCCPGDPDAEIVPGVCDGVNGDCVGGTRDGEECCPDGDCNEGVPKCWDLCETAENGGPNEITSMRDNFDGTLTFQLSRPITPGAVTTLTYTDHTGVRRATGTFTSHPGNVDGNASSDAADVTAIVAILNGGPALWDPYSMDIDRNGRFAPADMLRVIDLFNGSEDYEVWLGSPKPSADGVCPPSD